LVRVALAAPFPPSPAPRLLAACVVTARLSSPPRTRAGSFGSRLSGRVFMACFLVWGQGGGGPGARRAAVRGRPWAVKALGTCIGSALSAGLGVHCSRVLGLCTSAQPAAGSRASECSSSGSAQPQAANQAFRPQLSESLCLSGITSFRAYRRGRDPDEADGCQCCDATAPGSRYVARWDPILSNMSECLRSQS
jgi:hypothetical protein